MAVAGRCSRAAGWASDGWTALTWYAPALLFMTLPGGTAIQVVQEAVPNRLRGQASAIYYLANSIVGLTLGPLSVGLLTDYVYEDPLRIGSALALVAIVIAPITTVLAFPTRAPFARLVSRSAGVVAQRPVLISVDAELLREASRQRFRLADRLGAHFDRHRVGIDFLGAAANRREPGSGDRLRLFLVPFTWLAMRVSTEPTNSAVTVVPCAASSARRHVDIARAANLEGL